MGNPRRVYIYPSERQDDGISSNPFLPLGTIDDPSQAISQDYPGSYGGHSGGLLGLLLQRMQQGQDQPGVDSRVARNNAPETDSGSYGGPQSGLLGRLAAPQAGQAPYQPSAGPGGQMQSEPRDLNFRRLSGTPVAVGSQRVIDSGRPVGSSSQNSDDTSQAFNCSTPSARLVSSNSNLSSEAQNLSDLRNRAATLAEYLQNSTQAATPSGNGLFGAYNNKPGPSSIADSPPMKTAQIAIPVSRPLPGPLPPITMPPIPMPHAADWWKAAGAILQLYPRILSGMGGGGGGDEEDCKKEIREARQFCTDAFVDGWKGYPGAGPYRKPSREPWNIQDCMRGRISERCGGNAIDKK